MHLFNPFFENDFTTQFNIITFVDLAQLFPQASSL